MKMRKIGLMLLGAFVIAGCSSGPKVTIEEAEKAFIVGIVVVFSASMEIAMGETPKGVSLSEDEKILTIDKYDLSEFKQLGYTEVSGSVTDIDSVKVVDLTFVGGPVKTMEYEIDEALDMSNIKITILANGNEVAIEIDESDFDALEGQ
jgi:hypothetical protein